MTREEKKKISPVIYNRLQVAFSEFEIKTKGQILLIIMSSWSICEMKCCAHMTPC